MGNMRGVVNETSDIKDKGSRMRFFTLYSFTDLRVRELVVRMNERVLLQVGDSRPPRPDAILGKVQAGEKLEWREGKSVRGP